jgi:hypothetical protein
MKPWKDWPYWLKGGVVGAGIGLFLCVYCVILTKFGISFLPEFMREFLAYILPCGYLITPFHSLVVESHISTSFLGNWGIIAIAFFLIPEGLIIGMLSATFLSIVSKSIVKHKLANSLILKGAILGFSLFFSVYFLTFVISWFVYLAIFLLLYHYFRFPHFMDIYELISLIFVSIIGGIVGLLVAFIKEKLIR